MGLAMLTNAAMLSESKYLADFSVGFLGKKHQTLLIPIYSTTVLYDKEKFVILHSIGMIIVIKSKETRVVTYTCRYFSGHLIPNLTELYSARIPAGVSDRPCFLLLWHTPNC